jgi:hypothetical protein
MTTPLIADAAVAQLLNQIGPASPGDALTAALEHLRRAEHDAGSDPAAIRAVEAAYEALAAKLDYHGSFLVARNRFRIRHAPVLSLRRPRVLFGRSAAALPSFHLSPLLRIADVVSLSIGGAAGEVDVLAATAIEKLPSALARLPEGFSPDYYFDYQVENAPVMLRGLEEVDFPTVAGICHHFEAARVELIARLYDFVLPLSRRFEELISSVIDESKIISIPFGLCWGSFHNIVGAAPAAERGIDVLLSFGPGTDVPFYGSYRENVVRKFYELKSKYSSRFNFQDVTGADRISYFRHLADSKIVLNCVGVNGPYNYRTCEAMNAGAVLVDYKTEWITGDQYIEDCFAPGSEFISVDDDNIEAQLVSLLEDEPRRRQVSESGRQRVQSEFSYEALHTRLRQRLADTDVAAMRGRRLNASQAALARVRMHLRHRPAPQRGLVAVDLEEASDFDDLEGYRLMLALGPFVPNGPSTAEPARGVFLYDRLLSVLEAPTVVDRWNQVIACAELGRIDEVAVRALLADLDRPDLAPEDEEGFNLRDWPAVPGIPDGFASALAYRIRNLGLLVADGHAEARQRAVVDFMRAWLHGLLAQSGSAEDLSACDEIIRRYDIHARRGAADPA